MNSSGVNSTEKTSSGPKLGIIGGSGLCSFPELTLISNVRPETKYGVPSDVISLCEHNGQLVAFLPRHGSKHALAPHKIPYKANLQALKDLGVKYVIGTCIVGSLKKEITPGSFVLPDQFVNFTWGRDDYSAADGGSFIHLPMGEPYCNHLRAKILERATADGQALRPSGTVVVIQGPRFSTAAEGKWFCSNGWDLVNMTQYPECSLARELGLCYAAIATVTDFDVGLQEGLIIDRSRGSETLATFKANVRKTKDLLLSLVEHTTPKLSCRCAEEVVNTYYEDTP